MGVDDAKRNDIHSHRVLEEHSYYKMRKTTPWSAEIRRNTEKLVNGTQGKKAVQDNHNGNGQRFEKKARVEDIVMNLKKGKKVTPKKTAINDNSSFASMCTIREERDDIDFIKLPPLKKPSESHQSETPRDKNLLFLQAGDQIHPAPTSSVLFGVSSQNTSGSVNQVVYVGSAASASSKTPVNQVMYIAKPQATPAVPDGKTQVNQVIYLGSSPQTAASLPGSKAPANRILYIGSPPRTAPASSSSNPVNQVIYLNNAQTIPGSHNANTVPATLPSKAPAKQVSNLNQISVNQVTCREVFQRNFPKHDKQQLPLLLNKLPPGRIVNNNNASIPNSGTGLSNNPVRPQKQILLIARPGNPFYVTHDSKNHGSPTGSNENGPRPQVASKTNPTISPSATEVDSEPPLITVQYNLPYPNNTCKIVPNPAYTKYSNQDSSTFGSVNNLKSGETIYTLAPEQSRVAKPVEIPVSFAGNQAAHITTMSDESDILERQVSYVPSLVCGTSSEMLSARGNVNKQNDGVDQGARCNAELPRKHLKPKSSGNVKTKGRTSDKTMKMQQKGQESFPKKTTSKISRARANYHRAVDLDEIARTLSGEGGRPVQTKTMAASVRLSARMRQQTAKAKMMDKSTKKKTKSKKQSSRFSCAKNGKIKEKPLIKVKTEPLDECELSALVSSSDSGRLSTKSVLKKNDDSREGKTSPEEADASEKTDESGNLFRDPALLTREERALQRALLMFKEMEAKESRKEGASKESSAMSGPKQNVRAEMHVRQPKRISLHSRKRKLTNEGGQGFIKRRKIEVAKSQKKDIETSNNGERNEKRTIDIEEERGRRRFQLKVNMLKNAKERIKKHSVTVPKLSLHKLSGGGVQDDEGVGSRKETKKTKPVKDVTNIPQHLKSPKLPDLKSQEKPKGPDERHRVKTYMLIPSYNGFQDFSPVVLGSRTRNKKAEVKSDKEDDDVKPVKKVEGPKKDIPLLVIETVNNKPVKQDVVAKDDEIRDIVRNSLRAQGMLKKELELTEKVDDTEEFEHREKRNITVNRNTGETVLHKASRMGYDETVYHSIHRGCDTNAKDYAGWTPLHEASSRGHPNVVKVLVKYSADVNACSNDGIRPIHDAADNGNTDVIRLLLAYGADPLLSTYSGRSCLDCAKTTTTKDFIRACIRDLYLTDERNTVASLDYEDRWEFRGSSLLDKDTKYMNDIFEDAPKQQPVPQLELEWSDFPHLPTYNLPFMKDGVVIGRRNYVSLRDLQETLGRSRNSVVKMLKRTEVRNVSWSEFCREVRKSSCNQLLEPTPGNCLEDGESMVELVPLNCNVRSLLKIKTEHIGV